MTRCSWMWSLAVAFACAACGGDDGEGGNAGAGDASGTDAAGSGNATAGTGGAGGTGGAAGASGSAAGETATDEVPVLGPITPARDDGQVVPPWDMLCVATFTRDYDFTDGVDVVFSVQAGDRYLYGSGGFVADATIVLVFADGPVDFDIVLEPDETLPFTSSCDGIATAGYVCALVDTVVYVDADLTREACAVPAGACAHGSSISSYSARSSAPGFVYHFEASGFDDLCRTYIGGYVAATEVDIGDTTYVRIPFKRVWGPIEL